MLRGQVSEFERLGAAEVLIDTVCVTTGACIANQRKTNPARGVVIGAVGVRRRAQRGFEFYEAGLERLGRAAA